MAYKAKVIAGLLSATCVFSIIALILSAVNVKDVFLPPGTKVKPLAEAQLPSLTWVLSKLYSEIFPSFRQGNKLPCRLARQVALSQFSCLQHIQPFHCREPRELPH